MDIVEMLNYGQEKYHIELVRDNATAVNNGTVNHDKNLNEQERAILQQQIKQLLDHNHQLLEDNQRLRTLLSSYEQLSKK